jgi:hypothetical protein
VSALDCSGRTIWIADAHRGDGKRFVVRAGEKLTAFMELERVTREIAPRESTPDKLNVGHVQVVITVVALKLLSAKTPQRITFSLLPECRCESEEAFSDLRGRPGSKTENKCRLELRLDAIKRQR